jgi:hypothetical protein
MPSVRSALSLSFFPSLTTTGSSLSSVVVVHEGTVTLNFHPDCCCWALMAARREREGGTKRDEQQK